MNKSRLIWGIICLALAALLAVLTFATPEGSMMFTVGDTNVPIAPIAPAIILGIVGIVLLATAGSGTQKTAHEAQPKTVQDEEKVALNKRLETIGWGCFLIMLGGFTYVPQEIVANGVWSIGVGVIMLGLNVARYFYKIKLSDFTTVLGVVALISGITQLLGLHTLGGGVLLIILGADLILKPWFEKRQIFGKAEES